MSEYKIIRNHSPLLKFPIVTQTDTITVVVERIFRADTDEESYIGADSLLVNYSVEIVSSSRGAKRVYFSESSGADRSLALEVSVCGYLKSPNEERIAILLCVRRHHPSSGNFVEMFFVGAHLKIGW